MYSPRKVIDFGPNTSLGKCRERPTTRIVTEVCSLPSWNICGELSTGVPALTSSISVPVTNAYPSEGGLAGAVQRISILVLPFCSSTRFVGASAAV